MSTFSTSGERTSFAAALADEYEIDREIGRGGMGVVYLARDLLLDRMIAIKTLPSELSADAPMRERFLREARTAARLNHPNIVPVHRADEIAGQVFFVMGFVDGVSLAERLATGALSPRDAVPILRDVAAALGYAHKQNVIHRDVKTENILLETTTGRALVTDFGIARLAESTPLTATGQVLGTVYYLSPEQVSGDPVDARSDIYALGVVGYAMLSGKFPFDAPLASAVIIAHVTKQAVPLAVAAPHVPASLASIIDRCLAKDPAHRFQSCADLEAALASAETDASRVVARSKSPLLSDTEAHAVFKRASELEQMTGIQPRPAIVPMQRDSLKDARRKEGFKTQNLRDAADEAGIGADYMEHALAERGLRSSAAEPIDAHERLERPDRGDQRVPNVIHDLSKRTWFAKDGPIDIAFEMVVAGEVSDDDYALLIDTISHFVEPDGFEGHAASLGRSMTWRGRTRRGRRLVIEIGPRKGRTTIRVSESLKPVSSTIKGVIMGFGGGCVGSLFFALGTRGGDSTWGLTLWASFFALSGLVALTATSDLSVRRQKALKQLIDALGAQSRAAVGRP